MEEYRFGATAQAPRCWGKSYTEGDRECRTCGFQESCKGEIVRNAVNKPTMYAPPAQQMYQPYPQYAAQPVAQQVQVPVYQPPPQPQRITPRFFYGQPSTQQAPMQYPQYPQQMQYQPPQFPASHHLGAWPDPMHHYVHTIPPPMRHQMPGETFGERMVKNVGLAMLESLFANIFLSVRQMMWPPEPTYVDATPSQPVSPSPQK